VCEITEIMKTATDSRMEETMEFAKLRHPLIGY
jgi:hypothetical protein